MVSWHPGASLDNLENRAKLLKYLRAFFAKKNIIEIETPVLANAPVTDLHISSLTTKINHGGEIKTFYLQTSPEFAMKRLLAAYSEPIYQICKVFRHDPVTKLHNPEFTLLEWYRPGFKLEQLIEEVEELLCPLLQCESIPKYSYRELFEKHFSKNPHTIGSNELAKLTHSLIDINERNLNRTDHLQLLMSTIIEPNLPEYCFVLDYPKDQASLSVIEFNEQNDLVAKRFEVYCKGRELANGYFELIDAIEQRKRFEQDNNVRKQQGLELHPLDEKLLAAMEAGLPDCSGVALGVDRLFMVVHEIEDIDQALSFSFERA